MKITKQQLRQIIKEEISKNLKESTARRPHHTFQYDVEGFLNKEPSVLDIFAMEFFDNNWASLSEEDAAILEELMKEFYQQVFDTFYPE